MRADSATMVGVQSIDGVQQARIQQIVQQVCPVSVVRRDRKRPASLRRFVTAWPDLLPRRFCWNDRASRVAEELLGDLYTSHLNEEKTLFVICYLPLRPHHALCHKGTAGFFPPEILANPPYCISHNTSIDSTCYSPSVAAITNDFRDPYLA